MREVVIVEGIRTPVGRRNGVLKDVRPDDLAGEVLKKLIECHFRLCFTVARTGR